MSAKMGILLSKAGRIESERRLAGNRHKDVTIMNMATGKVFTRPHLNNATKAEIDRYLARFPHWALLD